MFTYNKIFIDIIFIPIFRYLINTILLFQFLDI